MYCAFRVVSILFLGFRELRMAKGLINWGEVKKHQSLKDRWIVIDNKVYDVSSWQNRHPGGRKVIGHYAGQDATVI